VVWLNAMSDAGGAGGGKVENQRRADRVEPKDRHDGPVEQDEPAPEPTEELARPAAPPEDGLVAEDELDEEDEPLTAAELAGEAKDGEDAAPAAAPASAATPPRSASGASRRRTSEVRTEAWARTPPARLLRSAVQSGVLVPLLRFIAPFSVVGKRNLNDLKGPAVFVANHQSHFDAPVCLAALPNRFRRRLVIAAAADYFYSSAVKGVAASLALGTVPFVRQGGSSRASLQMLKDLASKGWSVLIFPSGTRGAKGGFKKGFAYIAIDAQVPVVPMYLHGLDRVMPKGSFVPLPGGVMVGIGPPIPPGNDYNDLVRRAEAAVAETGALVERLGGK
jgi:1-acyl-sn-glycerol-3-phosphate acyltransferase